MDVDLALKIFWNLSVAVCPESGEEFVLVKDSSGREFVEQIS